MRINTKKIFFLIKTYLLEFFGQVGNSVSLIVELTVGGVFEMPDKL